MAFKFQHGPANLSGAVEQQGALTITGITTFGDDLLPSADGTSDLGSSAKEWQDLYIDGVAYIDQLQADALGAALDCNSQTMTNVDIDSGAIDGAVIGANSAQAATFTTLVANGNVDLGDNTSDTITATARFDSDLVPSTDSSRKLGTNSLQWKELHLDVAFIDQLGGELDASGSNIIGIADLGVDGNATFGKDANDKVNFRADISSSMIPSHDDAFDLGAVGSEWKDLHLDGTAYIDAAQIGTLTAPLNMNSQVTTNVNIDGGAIDGTAIGANSQSTIQGTLISASSNVAVKGNLVVEGIILPLADDNVDLGSSGTKFKDLYIDGIAYLDAINLAGTALAATATELNKLDAGVAGASLGLKDADSFIIGDASDSNNTKKVLLSDIKTYIGGGSTAVTQSLPNVTGAVGINYFGNVGGAVSVRMLGLVAKGESVIFKAGADCSTTNTITILASGSQKFDGLSSVVLESPYAAVELVCVADDTTFRIL